MSPLQKLIYDAWHVAPYDLLVMVFVSINNVWKEINSRLDRRRLNPGAQPKKLEGLLDRLKGLAIDTVDAGAIIISIWLLRQLLLFTLGEKHMMGGIPLSGLLDCAHFAVVFNWLLHCLRRTMP
jgi:hypothetical protein